MGVGGGNKINKYILLGLKKPEPLKAQCETFPINLLANLCFLVLTEPLQ